MVSMLKFLVSAYMYNYVAVHMYRTYGKIDEISLDFNHPPLIFALKT